MMNGKKILIFSIDKSQVEELLKIVKSLKNKHDIELFSNHMLKEYPYAVEVDIPTEEMTIKTEKIKKKDFGYIKKYIIEISSDN